MGAVMSYCGACGRFYWPGCPRRVDGVCVPAANPYEEAAVDRFASAVAVFAEACGMAAQNQQAARLEIDPVFDEEDFGALADGLRAEMGKKP